MSLYMIRALNAHLQEDTLYTCSIWYSPANATPHRLYRRKGTKVEGEYHMLHVYSLPSWRWAFKARDM